MLDEIEFKKAAELYSAAFSSKGPVTERMRPLLDYYKEVSGWDETVYNAIMHHRIEQYGPQCENCGKPYRTPKASFCAACGNKRVIC